MAHSNEDAPGYAYYASEPKAAQLGPEQMATQPMGYKDAGVSELSTGRNHAELGATPTHAHPLLGHDFAPVEMDATPVR